MCAATALSLCTDTGSRRGGRLVAQTKQPDRTSRSVGGATRPILKDALTAIVAAVPSTRIAMIIAQALFLVGPYIHNSPIAAATDITEDSPTAAYCVSSHILIAAVKHARVVNKSKPHRSSEAGATNTEARCNRHHWQRATWPSRLNCWWRSLCPNPFRGLCTGVLAACPHYSR